MDLWARGYAALASCFAGPWALRVFLGVFTEVWVSALLLEVSSHNLAHPRVCVRTTIGGEGSL